MLALDQHNGPAGAIDKLDDDVCGKQGCQGGWHAI